MSSNEVRKRREEQQVEIRRQKREENLAKRRNIYPSDNNGIDSDDEAAGEWEAQVCILPLPSVELPPVLVADAFILYI
jgi:importin subunit alpha-6/7